MSLGRARGALGPRILGRVISDEPVRGRFAYLEQPWLFGLPPHEQMRPFIERAVPLPPIHHLFGLAPEDASPGRSSWSIPARKARTAASSSATSTRVRCFEPSRSFESTPTRSTTRLFRHCGHRHIGPGA